MVQGSGDVYGVFAPVTFKCLHDVPNSGVRAFVVGQMSQRDAEVFVDLNQLCGESAPDRVALLGIRWIPDIEEPVIVGEALAAISNLVDVAVGIT
jgi:hypothetical protein